MTKAYIINYKKVDSTIKSPTYAHEGDVGMDVYSPIDASIQAGQQLLVSTGLIFDLPRGLELQVRPKSGLALKSRISITNSPGTIDSNYRGEVGVILSNEGEGTFILEKGMKFAQLVPNEVPEVILIESADVSETDRADGGYGSSGKF